VVGSGAAKAVGWRMGFTVATEDEDEDGTDVLSVILVCHRYFVVTFVTVIVEEQWGRFI
jgi:hypothetical protein